jgi:hypothetical protein
MSYMSYTGYMGYMGYVSEMGGGEERGLSSEGC